MADTSRAIIKFERLESAPFMLHEEVAKGNYRGKPVVLNRSIDSSVLWINYEGKSYKLQTGDIILGVLETING